MVNATDLKNGATFLSNGKPYKVLKYSHIKMGRGGAIVRVTAQNLESGSIEEKTFSSNIKVEGIDVEKRKLNYLYKDDKNAVFIDQKTYEQIEVPRKLVEEKLVFIKEGEEVTIFFWNNKPLSIEIPQKVVLTVSEAPPGVKGDSATNIYKSVILENGLKIKVPLFINKGEKIIVDTRTGEYLERAK